MRRTIKDGATDVYLQNVNYMSLTVKGAPDSTSFISVSTFYFAPTIDVSKYSLGINTLLALSNHSLKGISYQISRDQVEFDASSRPLSRLGHQQERRYLLAPKISRPSRFRFSRSDNKFFLRSNLTVAKVCRY